MFRLGILEVCVMFKLGILEMCYVQTRYSRGVLCAD